VWVALGCTTLVVLAGEALSMATGSGGDPAAALLLSFPIIGALIATRQLITLKRLAHDSTLIRLESGDLQVSLLNEAIRTGRSIKASRPSL